MTHRKQAIIACDDKLLIGWMRINAHHKFDQSNDIIISN